MKCHKCKKCRTTKVFVTVTDGKTHLFMLFNDIIEKIVSTESNDITKDLLMASAMKFSIDSNIVYSIKKL